MPRWELPAPCFLHPSGAAGASRCALPPQLDLKQHIRRRLSALKTRRYHPGKALQSRVCEIDSCAVCLEQFCKSQVGTGGAGDTNGLGPPLLMPPLCSVPWG